VFSLSATYVHSTYSLCWSVFGPGLLAQHVNIPDWIIVIMIIIIIQPSWAKQTESSSKSSALHSASFCFVFRPGHQKSRFFGKFFVMQRKCVDSRWNETGTASFCISSAYLFALIILSLAERAVTEKQKNGRVYFSHTKTAIRRMLRAASILFT